MSCNKSRLFECFPKGLPQKKSAAIFNRIGPISTKLPGLYFQWVDEDMESGPVLALPLMNSSRDCLPSPRGSARSSAVTKSSQNGRARHTSQSGVKYGIFSAKSPDMDIEGMF